MSSAPALGFRAPEPRPRAASSNHAAARERGVARAHGRNVLDECVRVSPQVPASFVALGGGLDGNLTGEVKR